MSRYRERGQLLAIVPVLVVALLAYVSGAGLLSLFRVEKIERQKEADMAVMLVATDQARALNEIAVLNEVLNVTLERAYEYALAMVLLSGCTRLQPWICGPPLARLAAGAPEFYSKINTLASWATNAQENLIIWANAAQLRYASLSTPQLGGTTTFAPFPLSLHIHRFNASDSYRELLNSNAFQEIFQRFQSSVPIFAVSPPYVLDVDFGVKQRVACQHRIQDRPKEYGSEPFRSLELFFPTLRLHRLRSLPSYASAYAQIRGTDLNQMTFSAHLTEAGFETLF